jgi:hypothetical protein
MPEEETERLLEDIEFDGDTNGEEEALEVQVVRF